MKNKLQHPQSAKEKYLLAFLLGFLTLLIALIPVMIVDKGYFIYYGDYNAQQIPFYNLANDTVRSGDFGWNWFTDLGSDFLTSYSFYLIGSPFFWFSTLLPRGLVTYAMPFLLALKHGLASLTAYIYIRRFVRSKETSLIGAMLYAFSGFQIFNIFFNHFQDVTAFFPLMLIAMEENINNRRRGWFGLIVAVMATINYYFFTGQVVFLILYFIMRLPCTDFHATWKKFFALLIEAVLGTAMAGFILLPSAMAILGNYRVSEHLFGENMVFYYEKSRVLRIIQSFFMLPDVPARPNLFKNDGSKWSSIGGYFPLFSTLGIITFMRTKKKHWAFRISLLCIICSFIPILNCMFYMFNASYYARWFYMPILIFAMMTAQTLDDEDADFVPAIAINAVVILVFAAISLIPEKKDGELDWFSFPSDVYYFWFTIGVTMGFLLFASYIIHRKNKGLKYKNLMVYSTAVASLICTLTTVIYGATSPESAKKYIDMAIDGKKSVVEEVTEDNFFRVDISENLDNYPMIWGLPNMRAFQSVVETSIMEFYDKIGVQRDVASRPDITHYTLRGLFSVKYFYREKVDGRTIDLFERMKKHSGSLEEKYAKDDDGEIQARLTDIRYYMPGFEFVSENENLEVYENKLYIPMGFAYDTYISEDDAEECNDFSREKMLIKTLVLNDEQIAEYSDILTKSDGSVKNMTKSDYEKACLEKQNNCSDEFTWDSHGFTSKITLDKPELVFFSVPYSKGWSAEVNGEPTKIEKVSYGFMAVPVQNGENTITFRYSTPYLKEGLIISVSALALFVLYMVICRFIDRKSKVNRFSHFYDYNSCHKITASELYIRNCHKNKED